MIGEFRDTDVVGTLAAEALEAALGSTRHPELSPAPGTYIHD